MIIKQRLGRAPASGRGVRGTGWCGEVARLPSRAGVGRGEVARSPTGPGRVGAKRCWQPVCCLGSPEHVDAVYGAVAQLVAHLHGMEGVRGSNPLSSTEK